MDLTLPLNMILLLSAIVTCEVYCMAIEVNNVNSVISKHLTRRQISVQSAEATLQPTEATPAPAKFNPFCGVERQNITLKHPMCRGTASTKIRGCYGMALTYEFISHTESGLIINQVNGTCSPSKSRRAIRTLTYTDCEGDSSEIRIRHGYMKIEKCKEEISYSSIPLSTDC